MVKNNEIPIKVNNKPFETVYELKNETQSVVGDQIPSFEEFMKTYEYDTNLNYADLNGGGLGEVRGYGPCSYSGCTYSKRFYLKIGFSCNKFDITERGEGDGSNG